ncbi:phosphate ABC transporter substrate-binding protein (PhoT family) [Ureibacillus xyleni]|uniref:Phosphate ABC transporter substrate-binding protein (PhoT family) n=1 Tax=Ureibacillus xyleni TaxID=614648 RepID=A0A285T112_9BACL|nr:substrate-binding domain-containing protein [Ureibacillus xyleni]SOC14915.1 phosphate ABC transporter substrate-binding protein (PhoT family) [Ureibacillus xyleni]
MNFFSSLMVFVCFAFILAPALFVLLLSGQMHFIPLILVVAAIVYLFIVFVIYKFFKTKKRKRVFGLLSGVAIVIASISPIKHMYLNSIPTVDAEVEIFQYRPFSEESKVVVLEEEATLKLSENLPKMDGATALYPLYSAIVQATYPKKDYYPYDSEVMVTKTPEAYSNLIKGEVDMIFAAAPSVSQQNYAKQLGKELKLTPIGREAFVFFVNQKNKVDGLTVDQIKGIYSGEITNWKEVGGDSDKIRAFQRPEESGSQTALQNLMGETKIKEAPKEDIATGMGGIISEVAQYKNFRNAIGYTFRYYSNEMVKNDQIKLLEIDGVAPTKKNIRNDSYPLSSEFYIVTAGSTNPNVEKLIDWVLSAQGQELVEKVGYVPLED